MQLKLALLLSDVLDQLTPLRFMLFLRTNQLLGQLLPCMMLFLQSGSLLVEQFLQFCPLPADILIDPLEFLHNRSIFADILIPDIFELVLVVDELRLFLE
jgi:hypothetical protein